MLILFFTLLVSALSLAGEVERQLAGSNLAKSKRGVIGTGHDAPRGYNHHQFQAAGSNVRNIQPGAPKPVSYYRNVKIVQASPLAYGNAYKQLLPYAGFPVHPSESQYPDNLFTISAGYKVESNSFPKSFKEAGANHHVPVYKTSYSLPKASEAQIYAPTLQEKKTALPILQVAKGQETPSYLSNFQSQPVVFNTADHQFNFGGSTPKVNNVQLSAPFLSPLSSFQGQVVPISTVSNSPQFPQYKGAAVEVYPTVAGFSTAAYQPLQTQPQLHFGHGSVQHVQPVDGLRHSKPIEEIRSDVEIIDKKKAAPPPKKDDDDNDEDEHSDEDEGYAPREKHYRENSEGDDRYEPKPGKYFQSPATEGNFKPSTSFPFKHYDEKFSKYSKQYGDEEADEKPFAKYHEYSSSSDDSDDERSPSTKYRSEDSAPKPSYGRQENEEDEKDDGHGYERQRTESSSDDVHRPKYFGKDFDEEFEASYRKELPTQRYVHVKEVPEVEYGSRSSKRNKDSYESEDKDAEGYSSDIVASLAPKTLYEGTFGHKIPRKSKAF